MRQRHNLSLTLELLHNSPKCPLTQFTRFSLFLSFVGVAEWQTLGCTSLLELSKLEWLLREVANSSLLKGFQQKLAAHFWRGAGEDSSMRLSWTERPERSPARLEC